MWFTTRKAGTWRGSRPKTVRIEKDPEAEALVFIHDDNGKRTFLRFAPDNYSEMKTLLSIVHTMFHNWSDEGA